MLYRLEWYSNFDCVRLVMGMIYQKNFIFSFQVAFVLVLSTAVSLWSYENGEGKLLYKKKRVFE